MILTDELRGIIVSRGLSQRKVAKLLGISEKTFYEKMKKKQFNSTEIEEMISILNIQDPMGVFFARKVTQRATMEFPGE